MAFITKETVKKIRDALKKEFPKVTFSVRMRDYSHVTVAVMKSSLFDDDIHTQHPRHPRNGTATEEQVKFIDRVEEIIRKEGEYFDHSDVMTDYSHTAFYYEIYVGRHDKNHKKI